MLSDFYMDLFFRISFVLWSFGMEVSFHLRRSHTGSSGRMGTLEDRRKAEYDQRQGNKQFSDAQKGKKKGNNKDGI